MKKIKSFELGGQRFKVKYKKNLNTDYNCWGRCLFDDNVIEMIDPDQCTDDLFKVTLFHELTHAILFTMGESELSKNEKFVDLFAQLATQLFKSLK